MSGLEQVLAEAAPWLHRYGYAAVAVSVMFEGAGIPLPGAILMSGAALLAVQGELNVVAVWLVAWLAAMTGDNLGYWIGRSGGRRLLLWAGVNRHRLVRFEGFFRHFGIWLILFGRFFDGTRQLDGLVAGSVRMSWPRFFLADLAGTLTWVSVWVIGLYSLDQHAALLHRVLILMNPWIAAVTLSVLGITLYLLFRRNASHHKVFHVVTNAFATSPAKKGGEPRRKRHSHNGGSK